jgi:hypothetical protein
MLPSDGFKACGVAVERLAPALVLLRDGTGVRPAGDMECRLLAEVERLRGALDLMRDLALSRSGSSHGKDGKCEYDDVGTGSSGMSPKPCAKHRPGREEWWCWPCQVKAKYERAALREEKH